MLSATKSIKQSFQPTPELLEKMETFRKMVNDCIRIGIANDVSTLKKLSKLCYRALANYEIISYYKLHAISKAAGILSNRRQSVKRGYSTKTPYLKQAILISSYGLKIVNGSLRVPIGDRQYFDIPLNSYIRRILLDASLTVRSFTLTPNNISLCISKDVAEIRCIGTVGVDRNLGNLTVGNAEELMQYDLSKTIEIADNTRSIIKSFKRSDVRIRKKIAGKYGRRRSNRVSQLLHHTSKAIVKQAKENNSAIAFEKMTYIRRLYQKGNFQGPDYRSRMNSWSFAEIKRLIEYKAQWEGVPIIQLSSGQTRGTSQLCPRCGKRVQEAGYKDVIHKRQLWCDHCQKWMDRDVVAAMNIAKKGAEVFQRSKGDAGEAMKGNPTTAVILRVDASKLSSINRRLDRTLTSKPL